MVVAAHNSVATGLNHPLYDVQRVFGVAAHILNAVYALNAAATHATKGACKQAFKLSWKKQQFGKGPQTIYT